MTALSAQERTAALTVTDRAHSPEDANLILQVLGLVPTPARAVGACPGYPCRHGAAPNVPPTPARRPTPPPTVQPQTTRTEGLHVGEGLLNWMFANGYARRTA